MVGKGEGVSQNWSLLPYRFTHYDTSTRTHAHKYKCLPNSKDPCCIATQFDRPAHVCTIGESSRKLRGSGLGTMSHLAKYLPTSVLGYVTEETGEIDTPQKHDYETVVLFADVSGYTAMCEAMARLGPDGEEYLAKNLNSYFELLIRAMSAQGGDVFKFAGDAILVVWPPQEGEEANLDRLVRRATQVGLEIQEMLQDAVLSHGVRLSVKIGIGAGPISILHLGGVFKRIEYLAVGEPLVQAFNAEHHASKQELVLSPFAWQLVRRYFEGEELDDGHAFVTAAKNPKLRKINIFKTGQVVSAITSQVEKNIRSYIPTAILPFASHNDDKWVNETRNVTVLFVNLGLQEHDLLGAWRGCLDGSFRSACAWLPAGCVLFGC